MRRIGLSALLCGAILLPATAADAKTRSVSITLHGTSHQLDSASHFAGDVAGSLGPGAIVYDVSTAGSAVKIKFTVFTRQGSLSGTAHVTVVSNGTGVNGTATFTGAGTITAGTAGYRGATGTFTVSGGSPAGKTTVSTTLRGKLKLRH